jgi:hypothetical protein
VPTHTSGREEYFRVVSQVEDEIKDEGWDCTGTYKLIDTLSPHMTSLYTFLLPAPFLVDTQFRLAHLVRLHNLE